MRADMVTGDTAIGRLGPITSFPELLHGLTNGMWEPGNPDLDYGMLYALPSEECSERRAALEREGYWSQR